jgi:hypothetical protein
MRLPELSTTGGTLYLWDNECQMAWKNMDTGYKADWLVMMDWFRENPSPYTEQIFEAIQAGLCPVKTTVRSRLTRAWLYGVENTDWKHKGIWVLAVGKCIGPASVIEFPRFLTSHYLYRPMYPGAAGKPALVTAEDKLKGGFRNRDCKPVYAFEAMPHAWSFLLSQAWVDAPGTP